MTSLQFRPLLFLLTGLLWLAASSLLGLGQFLGMILGKPLPPTLRLLHVHGALLGGVAQMILGAMLAFIPSLLLTGRDRSDSHPLLFAAINGGTLIALAGFALNHYALIALAGLPVLLAFLSLLKEAIRQVRSSLVSPPLNLWFYGVAVFALVAGLGAGEAVAAWPLRPQGVVAHARLAHIHLNVLGFVTLTIVGTMHNLFPTVLNTPLHNPLLARWTFGLLPSGVVLLVAGFLLFSRPVQIAAGVLLIAGTWVYGYNITRTWLDAGCPRSAPADHFMLATFFLVIAVITGLLVTINQLWEPPRVPFGTLHLMAYTHLALIGFVLQTILGALSHLLPVSLAVSRVKSNKKRGPYLAELTAITEQWRPLQVGALNVGTIGLALVASLVWQLPLGSVPVQVAAWVSAGLVALGLLLFGIKVVRLLVRQPEQGASD